MAEAAVTVDDLLKKSFSNRSRVERREILQRGKPRPELPHLMSLAKKNEYSAQDSKPDKCVIAFDSALYDSVEWLTGCPVREALYCWTCLLFRIDMDQWNRIGVKDLNYLSAKLSAHEKSVGHIQSALDMKLFLPNVHERDSAAEGLSNDAVKKRREVFRRIIDAVCALAVEQHPAFGKIHLKTQDCVKNLRFIRDYDFVQASIVDEAVGMLQESPAVLDDVVRAIAGVIKMSIQVEAQEARFVSMILSEHSRDPHTSQISVVLRYLKGGKVCERFVGFISADGEKTSNSICHHVDGVAKDFGLSQNLIAFSADGSVVRDMDAFLSYVDDVLDRGNLLCFRQNHISFIPCHFHRLDRLVQQDLITESECSSFLKNVEALRSFFRKGSEMWVRFLNFLRPLHLAWNLEGIDSIEFSTFFAFLKSCREDLLAFLEHVLGADESISDGNVVKIQGLCAFLRDFRAFYLIETFNKFFRLTSPLTEALYGDGRANVLHTALAELVHDSLLHGDEAACAEKSFEKFFGSIVETYELLEKPVPANVSAEFSNVDFYRALHSKILNCIGNHIKYRFLKNEKIGLFNVLNLKRRGRPLCASFVKEVTLAYSEYFDQAGLERELTSLENNQSFLDCESAHQVMELLLKLNLNHAFSNVCKLIELVLTLPCSLPNLNDKTSKLDEISMCTDASGQQENINDWNFLCIEREYMDEVRKRHSFVDEVMNNLTEINNVRL